MIPTGTPFSSTYHVRGGCGPSGLIRACTRGPRRFSRYESPGHVGGRIGSGQFGKVSPSVAQLFQNVGRPRPLKLQLIFPGRLTLTKVFQAQ